MKERGEKEEGTDRKQGPIEESGMFLLLVVCVDVCVGVVSLLLLLLLLLFVVKRQILPVAEPISNFL